MTTNTLEITVLGGFPVLAKFDILYPDAYVENVGIYTLNGGKADFITRQLDDHDWLAIYDKLNDEFFGGF